MAGPKKADAAPTTEPMAPETFEAYLLARCPRRPVLTIDGLDGYLMALIIGPKIDLLKARLTKSAFVRPTMSMIPLPIRWALVQGGCSPKPSN